MDQHQRRVQTLKQRCLLTAVSTLSRLIKRGLSFGVWMSKRSARPEAGVDSGGACAEDPREDQLCWQRQRQFNLPCGAEKITLRGCWQPEGNRLWAFPSVSLTELFISNHIHDKLTSRGTWRLELKISCTSKVQELHEWRAVKHQLCSAFAACAVCVRVTWQVFFFGGWHHPPVWVKKNKDAVWKTLDYTSPPGT